MPSRYLPCQLQRVAAADRSHAGQLLALRWKAALFKLETTRWAKAGVAMSWDQLRGKGQLYRRVSLSTPCSPCRLICSGLADHLDFGRNDVQLLADLLPIRLSGVHRRMFLRLGKMWMTSMRGKIRRQRLSAAMGSNRIGWAPASAAFLAHLAIGLIKERVALIFGGRRFSICGEDLVSQQPTVSSR